ncbi:hypothetical protein AMECASPLE_004250 [Ameca splendens]|uniref:Uncharacterized protein n=1 Tax=Ameca splendens TaxID=208324 RepID=A0ABV0ZIK6_9TELE
MRMWRQWTVTGVDFAAIPHTEHACSDSGEEKLPFNRKKPPAEPGSVCAAICHDQLGVRENRAETQREQRSTDPGVLSMGRKMLMDVALLVVSSRKKKTDKL